MITEGCRGIDAGYREDGIGGEETAIVRAIFERRRATRFQVGMQDGRPVLEAVHIHRLFVEFGVLPQ